MREEKAISLVQRSIHTGLREGAIRTADTGSYLVYLRRWPKIRVAMRRLIDECGSSISVLKRLW